jgi:predicted transcriptional regulator
LKHYLLREYRKQKGINQPEMREKTGISYNSYSRIEQGKQSPKMSQFKQIIEALELTDEQILEIIKD